MTESLIAILVCISFMANNEKHFFHVFTDHLHFFSWKNVYWDPLQFFSLIGFIVKSFEFSIFMILIFYQINAT